MSEMKICEICGTSKTYQRKNRKTPDWTKTETGVICKSCYSKEYASRKYVPHPRTPREGPCVECNSKTTYVEKSGYAKWYNGPNGIICKRCWNRQREKVMLPGQCVSCGVGYTHHGWTKTEKGTICNKCQKNLYRKIPRGGLCKICKITKSTSWRNHKEYGRICKKCYSRIEIKEIKIETLSHYSQGKLECAICGYDKNINGLELDHIEGKGSKDRKKIGSDGGWGFMKKLKKQGFPSGFQVLCATCNKIKQIEVDPK